MIELLSPAGSPQSLEAAVNSGCDAVYLGATAFNARISGENFENKDIEDYIKYCHLREVKVYITLNTIVSDREIKELLSFVEFINSVGVDGVIVQDLGLASIIRNSAPNLPLHASTQMTIHNLNGVLEAASQGFSRVVLSREISKTDLEYICKNSPIEIEAFIHGALCMSYSGQCYFSSVIGARSGNRGKCAQPCRQCYKKGYELSLKDLSMASNFKEFLSTGVTSLKIEGRLKSPEYVGGVTEIYRKLIDEKRNATKEEVDILAKLFSRQGFTNGYFENNPSKKMFGVRTEENKHQTKQLELQKQEVKRIPVTMEFDMSANQPVILKISNNDVSVKVSGQMPEMAQSRETTIEDAKKQLCKTGGTAFKVTDFNAKIKKGLMLPLSALNSLRRDAIYALEQSMLSAKERPFFNTLPKISNINKNYGYNFHFTSEKQLEGIGDYAKMAKHIWLPIEKITKNHYGITGCILPRIIFDSQLDDVEEMLKKAKKLGITKVLCHTAGQISICKKYDFVPFGSTFLNMYNSYTLENAKQMGFEEVTLSWECSSAQIRDITKPLPVNTVVYGRMPLMITQNCIIKNAQNCINSKGYYTLEDKTGAKFPVICEYGHRNVILNSNPLFLADKLSDFENKGLSGFDFIFTTEKPEEIMKIIEKYQDKLKSDTDFTRGLYYKKI